MFKKSTLDNGVRIVSEQLPFSTTSLGIWVDTGSRDEQDAEVGCAHFVEHMLFKGTSQRSARQIAQELDSLGGMSNAFTSKENTCVYATVLGSHLPKLTDLLCDLFLNSVFADEEIQRERQVILQEISMVEDTPDDQIHELFASLIHPDHPLGREVLGTRESVESITRERLLAFVQRHYTTDRILITAAGDLDHHLLVDMANEKFGHLPLPTPTQSQRSTPNPGPPQKRIFDKPLEQTHIIIGSHALAADSERRYTLHLLNIILGGNMSSRLFQQVRETHGLAYSIYSYLAPFADCGYLAIYLGVDQITADQALKLIGKEISRLYREPVSSAELDNTKEYAKGIMYLSAENMEARMTRLARNELSFERHIGFEEAAAAMAGVSAEEIQNLAKELFQGKEFSGAVLGPLKKDDMIWQNLD